MASTVVAGGSVVDVIVQVAQSLGVDPRLAVAIAQGESGLNPQAVGDQGTSFGLYQLHQGGELGTLTPQQAFDPVTNATTALSVVAAVEQAHPDWSPGQIAAAAQRPANPGAYADAVNARYQQLPSSIPGLLQVPSQPSAGASNVGATATLLASQSSTPSLLHVDMGVLGNIAQILAGGILILFGANLIVKDLTGASPFGAVQRVVAATPVGGPLEAVANRRRAQTTYRRTRATQEGRSRAQAEGRAERMRQRQEERETPSSRYEAAQRRGQEAGRRAGPF